MNQQLFDAAFSADPSSHRDDCEMIVGQASLHGIKMTNRQAYEVWGWYSAMRDAQWLSVYPEHVWGAIEDFC